jgi:hypothetical protein
MYPIGALEDNRTVPFGTSLELSLILLSVCISFFKSTGVYHKISPFQLEEIKVDGVLPLDISNISPNL